MPRPFRLSVLCPFALALLLAGCATKPTITPAYRPTLKNATVAPRGESLATRLEDRRPAKDEYGTYLDGRNTPWAITQANLAFDFSLLEPAVQAAAVGAGYTVDPAAPVTLAVHVTNLELLLDSRRLQEAFACVTDYRISGEAFVLAGSQVLAQYPLEIHRPGRYVHAVAQRLAADDDIVKVTFAKGEELRWVQEDYTKAWSAIIDEALRSSDIQRAIHQGQTMTPPAPVEAPATPAAPAKPVEHKAELVPLKAAP